jgi:acyl-CoA synthetase (NDP forming)
LITTGNEADLGLEDVARYLLDDDRTGGIVIYAEQPVC